MQFAALAERHRLLQYRADLRVGVLDALIVNALRGKKGRKAIPEDFVLDRLAKPRRSLSQDALVTKIKAALSMRPTGDRR